MNQPVTGTPGSAPGPAPATSNPTPGPAPAAPIATAAPGAPTVATKPTAVKKEPGEPKVKKARVKKEGAVARPRLPKYPDEHVITVLKPDSKARGAAERFNRFKTGMTVKEYVTKIHEDFGRTVSQTQADMRWDEDHKFIHVGPTVIAVPPPEVVAPTPTPPPVAGQPAPAQATH